MTTEIAEYTKTENALAELRTKYKDAVFDVATTKGISEARAARAELRTLRTDLEKERVRIKAPALERCRLIDAEAKRITVELAALEDPIDSIIKAEENRKEQERLRKLEEERQRQIAIQSAIDGMRNVPASLIGKPAIIIKGQLAKLKEQSLDLDFFGEYFRQAEDAHAAAVAKVQEMLQTALDAEAEAARVKAEREELERMRAENERLQREAEERRRADELRAQREREDAERKEREAREAQEREQAEAVAKEKAEKEAALKRERERIEAIRAAIDAIKNVPANISRLKASEVREEIEALEILNPRASRVDFAEFKQEAEEAYDSTLVHLQQVAFEAQRRDEQEALEQLRREEDRARLEAEAQRQRREQERLDRERQELETQREAERLNSLTLVEAARVVVSHYCQQGAPEPPKCIYDLAAVLEQQNELPHQKRDAVKPVRKARNAA